MTELSDNQRQNLIKNLKQNLQSDANGHRTLATEFESAAKHLPAYTKIVKIHIEQLRKVLELETHNHRTLENAGLAEPVQQLIELFSTLQDEDIQMLEDLATVAHNWQVPSETEVVASAHNSNAYVETTS